jgi:hypothetical protein
VNLYIWLSAGFILQVRKQEQTVQMSVAKYYYGRWRVRNGAQIRSVSTFFPFIEVFSIRSQWPFSPYVRIVANYATSPLENHHFRRNFQLTPCTCIHYNSRGFTSRSTTSYLVAGCQCWLLFPLLQKSKKKGNKKLGAVQLKWLRCGLGDRRIEVRFLARLKNWLCHTAVTHSKPKEG